MKKYYFADGVEDISFSEGMVRLNLFHYGEKRNGNIPHEITEQLILPPTGFLRAFETMQKMIAQMEKQGLITKASLDSDNKEGNGCPSSSPNFR